MSILASGDRPTVGVRELRQNASKVLAAVESEQIGRIITVNGRPVAALVPLKDIIVDEPGHRIEKIGIPRDVFLAQIATFPVDPVGLEFAAEWLADIRSLDDEEDFRDPFERAGL